VYEVDYAQVGINDKITEQRTKEYFTKSKVEFEKYNLSEDDVNRLQQALKELTSKRMLPPTK
jgi:hypothetical protein